MPAPESGRVIACRSRGAIDDSILAGFGRKRLRAPGAGAMAYMLYSYAWTASSETGAPIFLGPHLHIYTPYSTPAQMGIDTTARPIVPVRLERDARQDVSMIVGVRLVPPAP